jgi:pimeloyl-ACP methyl ester carboxylesterase
MVQPRSPLLLGTGLALAALGVSAVANTRRALEAERATSPVGRFVEVAGVRLHVLERGAGPTLLLLHGNGSLIQDWLVSGLVERAAARYRVIALDRPGFGYSARPRGRVWTPRMQAGLMRGLLHALRAEPAIVLGHSWGAQVALALALEHPEAVRALVLESGYYFPTPRLDTAMFLPQALPGLGDAVSRTLAPPLGRLLWPRVLHRLFAPAPVPARFAAFPREMVLRPSHLRTAAAETVLMQPEAFVLERHYRAIAHPIAILSGTGDRQVDHAAQAVRLARTIPGSRLVAVEGAGHMLHHLAPETVLAAIDSVAG